MAKNKAAAKGKDKAKAVEARPILYPKLDVKIFDAEGEFLTAAKAKEFLGWEETTEKEGALFTDENGKKIVCTNNIGNRPFREGDARKYAQDILNRNWADSRHGEGRTQNGETIIIGRTGRTLSGQHRLIGLVLASQIWAGKQKDHWKDKWTEEPSIEAIVVVGVDESAFTTRTLDNVIPRTLSDVLFADTGVFGKVKPKDRSTLCRMTDYAVRMMWSRAKKRDAFSPYRTHSESLEFIDRHPRLVKAVKHVFEENKENGVGKIVSPGLASGLMYLMGCSSSDAEAYYGAEVPSEKKLNWDNWSKAEEFWVLLGSASPSFLEVRHALGALNDEETGEGGSLAEKTATLIKAWNLFVQGKKIVEGDLKLTYTIDEDGVRHLVDFPTVGGIDRGSVKEEEAEEEEEETPAVVEKTPEELRKEKIAAQREKLLADKAAQKKAKEDAKRAIKGTEGLTPAGQKAAAVQKAAPAKNGAVHAPATTEPVAQQ